MIKRLNEYYEKGLVYKQVHPYLPLVIWNYSEKVQYEGLWDDLTLMCRGLITDDKGKIIVKPFGKFFNYEEVEGKGLVPWSTSEYVYIQEKMDGSLGILFKYEGTWIMATRGSFTSDQAVKGLEIATEELGLKYAGLEPSFAYLVEIIYGNSTLEYIEVELEDGKIIKLQENQKIKTNRGEIFAKDLQEEDIIINL